ncbi:MAG: ATP-binding protein [Tunicatimonas sp.]
MSNNYSIAIDDLAEPDFRTEIIEKIRQIAEREDQAQPGDTSGDLRGSVRKVLEEFQSLVIQRNIWIRIYDDNERLLPTFDRTAAQAVGELIKNALRRHRTGRMLAYVEISFLINETGTVVTVEDNAPSVTTEELAQIPFLQQVITTDLPGGFTLQGVIGSSSVGQKPTGHHPVGHLSVRCVTGCFTRFSLCFSH